MGKNGVAEAGYWICPSGEAGWSCDVEEGKGLQMNSKDPGRGRGKDANYSIEKLQAWLKATFPSASFAFILQYR